MIGERREAASRTAGRLAPSPGVAAATLICSESALSVSPSHYGRTPLVRSRRTGGAGRSPRGWSGSPVRKPLPRGARPDVLAPNGRLGPLVLSEGEADFHARGRSRVGATCHSGQ